MLRLRLIFILSLVILAGVFISVVHIIPSGSSYTESRSVQIIEGEDEWILQCDIANDEESDIEYTIIVTVDGEARRDSMVVQPGKTYTYICHIYPQQLDEGKVSFALYEGDKEEPVEQATYYIGSD